MTDGGHATRRHLNRVLAAVGAIALGAGALVGVGASAAGAGTAAAKGPKQGGEVSFGLEAETTGGYCLSQAQLAISGIQVAAAIYDTLTVPNSKGQYVPYLAKSVTPNADFTEWTIALRDGIKFQNGEALDANAVKLNLDSYRGSNPNLPARLFTFVFTNIADVSVVDPLTVKVTTKVPWPAFPGYLYSTGRLGIMAPAQMNDAATCATNMIGTGPFKLVDWKQNESLVVERNPNYWQKDAKGNQLPYLDKITFVPVVDASARDNQLEGGQLDLEHTSTALSIDKLQQLGSSQITLLHDKSGTRDERYYMFNTAKAPFNDIAARQAVAYAINRQEINQIRNKDLFTIASGIYDKGATGYVEEQRPPEVQPQEGDGPRDPVQGGARRAVHRHAADDARPGQQRRSPAGPAAAEQGRHQREHLAARAERRDQRRAVGELQPAAVAQHPQRPDVHGLGELRVVLRGFARELRQVQRPAVPGPARPGPRRIDARGPGRGLLAAEQAHVASSSTTCPCGTWTG